MRNDHDAALARVKALEDELARERADDHRRDERMAALDAELRSARQLLEAAARELAELRPPAPASPPVRPPALAPVPAPDPGRAWIIAVGIVGVIIVLLVLVSVRSRSPSRSGPAVSKAPARKPVDVMPDDIAGYLEEARAKAQELLPGSRIISMTGEGIDQHGRLHPSYGEFSVELHRVNPSPDEVEEPGRPIGAPPPPQAPHDDYSCLFLDRDTTGWRDNVLAKSGLTGFCPLGDLKANRSEISPVCTMKSIWQRALADGARDGAIAKIRYEGRWHFEIDDDRARFERDYDDDCIIR